MSNDLSEMAKNMYGLDISQYDDSFLTQSTHKRLKALGINNISEYMRFISETPEEAAILFRSLNITHTDFFRNSLTFAHLEQWILPSLLSNKSDNSELRIWSADCSSGLYGLFDELFNYVSI